MGGELTLRQMFVKHVDFRAERLGYFKENDSLTGQGIEMGNCGTNGPYNAWVMALRGHWASHEKGLPVFEGDQGAAPARLYRELPWDGLSLGKFKTVEDAALANDRAAQTLSAHSSYGDPLKSTLGHRIDIGDATINADSCDNPDRQINWQQTDDASGRSMIIVIHQQAADPVNKLSEIVLGITGQAAVSLVGYSSQSLPSPYLCFVVAANAVGFIGTLAAVSLRRRTSGAASVLGRLGAMAAAYGTIAGMGLMFLPEDVKIWASGAACLIPSLALAFA